MTTSIYQSSTLVKRRYNFKVNAQIKHDYRYTYPNLEEEYKNNKKVITIYCEDHGNFPQTPNRHLNGDGCPKCGTIRMIGDKTSNTDEFIDKVTIAHNAIYTYPNTVYVGSDKQVYITCSIHGDFPCTPNNHLKGKGCPKCSTKGYSKIAIKWLESLNNTNIQHALNGGEYKIIKQDGSHFKADGYDSETNTVYEFHGDHWHGNPDLYESEEHCHPFNKEVTAGELYYGTINRENEIKALGYNLVVMWESDYKKGLLERIQLYRKINKGK